LWKIRYAQNETLAGERDDTYALLVPKHRASGFLEWYTNSRRFS